MHTVSEVKDLGVTFSYAISHIDLIYRYNYNY